MLETAQKLINEYIPEHVANPRYSSAADDLFMEWLLQMQEKDSHFLLKFERRLQNPKQLIDLIQHKFKTYCPHLHELSTEYMVATLMYTAKTISEANEDRFSVIDGIAIVTGDLDHALQMERKDRNFAFALAVSYGHIKFIDAIDKSFANFTIEVASCHAQWGIIKKMCEKFPTYTFNMNTLAYVLNNFVLLSKDSDENDKDFFDYFLSRFQGYMEFDAEYDVLKAAIAKGKVYQSTELLSIFKNALQLKFGLSRNEKVDLLRTAAQHSQIQIIHVFLSKWANIGTDKDFEIREYAKRGNLSALNTVLDELKNNSNSVKKMLHAFGVKKHVSPTPKSDEYISFQTKKTL